MKPSLEIIIDEIVELKRRILELEIEIRKLKNEK